MDNPRSSQQGSARQREALWRDVRAIVLQGELAAAPDWRARGRDGVWPLCWEAIDVADRAAAQEVLPLAVGPAEPYLRQWDACRDPADRERAEARLREALWSGASGYANEFRCTDRDGCEHWLYEVVSLTPLDECRWRFISVATDVTALKHSELAAAAAQEHLRLVARGTRCILTSALVEAEPDWRERALATERATTPFRWTLEVIDESAAQEVLPLDVPPGASYYETWLRSRDVDDQRLASVNAGQAFLAGSGSYRNEWRCRDRWGQERWQQQVATVQPLGEGRWRVFGLTTDVTDLKAAEAEARAGQQRLLEVTRQARCVLRSGVLGAAPHWRDASLESAAGLFDWSQVRIVNPDTAAEILPLAYDADETYTDAWLRARDPADQRQLDEYTRRELLAGRLAHRGVYSCTDRFGQRHWMQRVLHLTPLDDCHWQVFGSAIDITELREAEAAARAGAEQMLQVTRHTRCILNAGVVTGAPDWRDRALASDYEDVPFEWAAVRVLNVEAAQEVLPLDVPDGSDYQRAWAASRREEDQVVGRRSFGQALAEGRGGCSQEYRCLDRHGVEHCLRQEVTIQPLGGDRWQVFGIAIDVTDLRRAEQELRTVLTNARCILWHAEVEAEPGWEQAPLDDWHNLRWRLEVQDLHAAQQVLPLDVPPGQRYEDAWVTARHDADREALARCSRQALRDGLPGYSQDFRCRDLDGQLRWLHEDVVVRPLGPGRWALFGVDTDITARRLAEEERHAVLANARCLLWHGDVYCPPGWEDEDAVPPKRPWWRLRLADEQAGQQVVPLDVAPGSSYVPTLLATRNADDVEKCGRVARAALHANADGFSNEFRVVDRHGQTHWLREQVTLQPSGPSRWQVFVVATDITARRQAEAELRAVLTNARCILWHAEVTATPDCRQRLDDPELGGCFTWRVTVQDEHAAQQVVPLDVEPGRTYVDAWFEARHPEDREQMYRGAVACRALLAGDRTCVQEFRSTDRSGRVLWQHEELSIQPLDDLHWQVVGVVTDVTERRHAEEERRALLTNARCILWSATVTCETGPDGIPGELEWSLRVEDERAAQQVLELDLAPGQSYADGWLASRLPADQERMNATRRAWRTLTGCGASYEQEYRHLDRWGHVRWLHEDVAVEALGTNRWRLVGVVTDISEQQRNEEERRAVLTNTRCILWHGEVRGEPGWREMPAGSGYRLRWDLRAVDEQAGQSVVPLDVPAGEGYLPVLLAGRRAEDLLVCNANAERALRAGVANFAQEYRVRDRDGREVWLHEEATVEPLGPDRWRWYSVATDVTDRKRAEEEQRALLTNARCILWHGEVSADEGWEEDHDLTGGFTHWQLRVSDEHSGQHVVPLEVSDGEHYLQALVAARLPEDSRECDRRAHEQLVAGARSYEQVYRVRDARGRLLWLHESVTVQPLGERSWRLFGVVIDVTATEQAAEELHAVLTNARCILWRAVVTGSEGWRDDPANELGALHWEVQEQDERAAQQVLHLELADGGSHWAALKRAMHAEDAAECNRAAHAALLQGARRYLNEFRCTDLYGKTIWLREEATVQPEGPDRWVVVGVAVDVTERKEAEQERLELDRRMQQSQRLESLGVLAGGIAHDFNNLLMAILGNTELARFDAPPGSEMTEALGRVETAAHRAAELCRQMLAYAGKGRVVTAPVDLLAMVGELTHLLQATVSKRAQLLVEVPADLPAVWGDASQLRQVFMNLVINASEALGEQDGVIRVSAGLTNVEAARPGFGLGEAPLAPGQYVRVTVADSGCGMSPETLQRIFEPFYTTKFTGRGLGLSAVMGIVRGHKGELLVESTPGVGTTFTVLLPVAEAAPTPSVAAPGGADARRGRGTILLVDDEEVVRETSELMLRSLGFEVVVAVDGLDAVERYRAERDRIDLVLLDLTMPRLSGDEAFAQLRALNSRVKVVVASGYGESDLARRFAGTPLLGAIQKPYTLATLRAVLVPLLPEPGSVDAEPGW